MSVELASTDGRQVIWQAQPRQDVALTCPAFEVCYGGTKGGGKTDFLVVAPWQQIMLADAKYRATGRKQRGRAIIFRKNLRNLNDIIERCQEIYPELDPEMGLGGWSKMEKRWRFSSGYVVDLAHLDGPDDHLGYNGQEITALLFDQVEEISQEVYQYLVMQVRSKDPDMRELLMVRCTANPGGKYAAWVKEYFYNGCKPHNRIVRNQVKLRDGRVRETTKAFIPATLYDNKYLSEDGQYEATLLKLPDHMRRMYLDGDWDVVVGARFAHLWRRDIHVISSFPIPGSWPVKGGLDWGSTAPACAHWAAKDNDGNVYFIDELYCPGDTGRAYGEKMVGKFNRQQWSAERKYGLEDVYFLMDRQARANMGGDGTWSNPAAGIASWGIRLFDANKDRASRVEQWSERLRLRANGRPRVYIFGDRCPQLASVIPTITSDPTNPDDTDPDFPNDHPYDSSSFLLMDWPLEHPNTARTQGDKDVERWLELARARQRPAGTEGDISTGYDG